MSLAWRRFSRADLLARHPVHQHGAVRDVRGGNLLGGGRPGCLRPGGDGPAGHTGAHPENPTLTQPCRLVLAAGSRETEVTGPLHRGRGGSRTRGLLGLTDRHNVELPSRRVQVVVATRLRSSSIKVARRSRGV